MGMGSGQVLVVGDVRDFGNNFLGAAGAAGVGSANLSFVRDARTRLVD